MVESIFLQNSGGMNMIDLPARLFIKNYDNPSDGKVRSAVGKLNFKNSVFKVNFAVA